MGGRELDLVADSLAVEKEPQDVGCHLEPETIMTSQIVGDGKEEHCLYKVEAFIWRRA